VAFGRSLNLASGPIEGWRVASSDLDSISERTPSPSHYKLPAAGDIARTFDGIVCSWQSENCQPAPFATFSNQNRFAVNHSDSLNSVGACERLIAEVTLLISTVSEMSKRESTATMNRQSPANNAAGITTSCVRIKHSTNSDRGSAETFEMA